MVCQSFNKSPILESGKEHSATISVGIALYPEHGDTGKEILHCADLALYQAKQVGRNRVCVWER